MNQLKVFIMIRAEPGKFRPCAKLKIWPYLTRKFELVNICNLYMSEYLTSTWKLDILKSNLFKFSLHNVYLNNITLL
jgi:hypothetical protein